MDECPTLPFDAPERWVPVPGYEGLYEISDLARVRSLRREGGRNQTYGGRLLKWSAGRGGRYTVGLSRGGHGKNFPVHSLVAAAFLGPCPEGLGVLHGYGDCTNNVLSNLRYGTQSENLYDAVRHGTHFWAKRTHCKNGHEFTPENTRIRPLRRHRKQRDRHRCA